MTASFFAPPRGSRITGTLLITGGAGYIGSHATIASMEAGWSPVVIDNLSTGSRAAVPSSIKLYVGDVQNERLLNQIIHDHRVVAIMHFAGSIVVPDSIADPLSYYSNNTVASHTLLSAAVNAGVQHILFSSTAAVYGEAERVPVREDDPTLPINPYGASKLMTEHMLRDASRAHDFNFAALRYFNVAGADPKGRTGQRTKGATHLIKVALEAALGKRKQIDVFGTDYLTPDGTCIRDYIHVSDLASAHLAALEWLIRHPTDNLVLNCGYGRGVSVLEVLDAVERATGHPVRRQMKARRAGDAPVVIASNERIRETLEWQPKHQSIDIIVRDALRWERSLPQ